MPNTSSAKKALRGSLRKRENNLAWKRRIANAIKNFKKTLENNPDTAILNQQQANLQKILDKAAKEKVIHKNKASRLKSRYAQKITAVQEKPAKPRGKQREKSKSTK